MSAHIPLQRVRNIGLSAHVDSGKTTTTERILYYTGRVHKLGEVHEGQATMDWLDQEQERGITIMSAATTCFWTPTDVEQQDQHRINLIDTPGHVDFQVEVSRSLRVLDGAIALFDSVAGVEPQSETVWRMMDRYQVPRICFVNKMDREGADFLNAVQTMRDRLGANPIPIQLPIGDGKELVGIIDLVNMQSIVYHTEDGKDYRIEDIPEQYAQQAEEAHHQLIDAVAEHHDPLMEAYLEDESSVTPEMIRAGIRNATLAMAVQPVLAGSAFKNKGIQPLLDAIVAYLPSPLDREPARDPESGQIRESSPDEPFAALAFKIQRDQQAGALVYFRVYSGKLTKGQEIFNSTTGRKERAGRILMMHANHREDVSEVQAGDIAVLIGAKQVATGDTLCDPAHPLRLEVVHVAEPVVHVAVEPVTRADQDKLGEALNYLVREDPSLRMRTDEETGQTVLSGMGELHLEVVVERLRREYKVDARIGKPQVAYREAVTAVAENVEGKIKRQTGGSGQYARVLLNLEPNPGQGFSFVSAIKGGSVPTEYIPAVEKGIAGALSEGVVAGYPMEDVKVTLVDGDYHEVDSSDLAFQVAGAKGFRAAARKAKPVLMEPLMSVEVTVPEEYLGTVMGDITRRRGTVEGHDARPGGAVALRASVPLSEMFGYANDLRSSTQGRGNFTMHFSRYEQLPGNLATEIKAARGVPAEDQD